MVAVVIGVCWEFWETSNEESSNGHVGSGQGEAAATEEQESKSHVDGQMGAIPVIKIILIKNLIINLINYKY